MRRDPHWSRALRHVHGNAMLLAIATSALTSCALLQPDYGEAPEACGFSSGTRLAWRGHGIPADFDLMEVGGYEPIAGDIYVEADPVLPRPNPGMPEERWVCVIVPPGHPTGTEMYGFAVPNGWQPP